MPKDTINWIAADWGTSNLRVWAMSSEGTILAGNQSSQGMSAIAKAGGNFEAALLDLIHPWLPPNQTLPVIACGMVGARQGWQEVPYATAPCSPQTPLTQVPSKSTQIEVYIHAGVCQENPADVMRGEETQIAGLLAQQPDFEGLVCLPGTHSKWAQIQDGKIQSFHTFMTGEVFSLLSEHSILRLTTSNEGSDENAFQKGILEAYDHPERFLSNCFSLRAEHLLHDLDAISADSRLSGLVIGHELSSVLKELENQKPIALIGSGSITRNYKSAQEALGRPVREFSTTELTLKGLTNSFVSQSRREEERRTRKIETELEVLLEEKPSEVSLSEIVLKSRR